MKMRLFLLALPATAALVQTAPQLEMVSADLKSAPHREPSEMAADTER